MKLQANAYKVFKNITVEPATFTYFLVHILLEIIDTNLYLQKACRHNTTTEPNLDIPCDDEKAGVLFVSSINANYRYFEMTAMITLTTLLLSWSDEAGRKRKILILVPIIGIIVQSINGCLQSYFWHWPPIFAAVVDICAQVFSGGFVCMAFSAEIYLCDISNVDDRTMRLGILTALFAIAHPIANGVSGFLIRNIGFINSFLVCLLLSMISLVLGILLIKDNSVPTEKKVSFLSVFKCTRIVEGFNVAFKNSLGRRRMVVLLLLITNAASRFSAHGEQTVFYLFLRYKFKWDERIFSVYQIYKLGGLVVGTIFCSIVLSKILKLHDGIIGTFAGFWDVLAALGYIFASQTWHLYLVPLLDIFHKTALTISFSYLSKFYDSSEFGRLKSLYCISLLFVPLCQPAYNIIFQTTLDSFPSAFFVLSAAINTAVCFLFAAAYILTKKIDAQELAKNNDG